MMRLNCRMDGDQRVQEATEMASRSDEDRDGPEAGLPAFKMASPRGFEPRFSP